MITLEIFALDQVGFPILSALLFLPLATGLALRFAQERIAYSIALVASAFELVLALAVAFLFVHGTADAQFVERSPAIPGIGISYHVGVDGISVLFLPIIALITLLVVLYAEYSTNINARDYLVATLTLEATLIGAFIALDLAMFWVFFVLELVPAYFLIARWGTGAGRVRAAREYVTFMLLGSAAMLAGIVALAVNARSVTGSHSFDFVDLLRVPVPVEQQVVIFFLLFVGFAIKAPVFPFHTWMPKVLEQGSVIGVSVFLVGIKLGTYGFLRFVIPLLPEGAREWSVIMLVLGGASIVYGAMIALIQTNLRRLLAFGSLSHMGMVMLGMFSLNLAGFQGALLQMINLGIVGAGLFFVAGFLHARTGPPDLSVLGGLLDRVPVLAATFLVIAVAGIGLPGTNGFNGEHLVVLGAFESHWLVAIIAGAGTFLTAAYSLRYFQRAFLGEPAADASVSRSRERTPMRDLRVRELIISIALGGLVFWIGLDTGPFLRMMDGSLSALESRVATEPVQAAPTHRSGITTYR